MLFSGPPWANWRWLVEMGSVLAKNQRALDGAFWQKVLDVLFIFLMCVLLYGHFVVK